MKSVLRFVFLAGVYCAAVVARGEVVVESPGDYQVVQRDGSGFGTVELRGRVSGSEAVEARFFREGETVPVVESRVVPEGDGFGTTVRLPAGGWYRLEVTAKDGAQVEVAHVGVGEVFVVAGQSNSANHGEERQRSESGMVASCDEGGRWRVADDPQPGASGGGGSFLPGFGDAMARRFGVPVGLVACGIGATSVREWLPEGDVFPNPPTIEGRVRKREDGQWESKGEAFRSFAGRVKALGARGCRAVLWHQGESDANQADASRTLPGEQYRAMMGRLIGETRREIGWEVPWFVAQVSYHVPGDEASEDIRAAQAALWRDGLAQEGPDSDALKGMMRDSGGKGVHFSGPGLREHAARWVEKVGVWLERELEVMPGGLVLDLDARRGVTVVDGGRVVKWRNQVAGNGAQDFVSRDEGRGEAGSGRPTLVKDEMGRAVLDFRQQELVCMDEDVFDGLVRGGGCTWVALMRVHEQREGLKDVNSFFGNLRNEGMYEGVWGCFDDENTVWWGPRNGLSFGRFDGNNPKIAGPKLEVGKYHVVAGRLGAGTGMVRAELFVDGGAAVAGVELPVNPAANPSRMAIGQERDAIQHPGHESFDGQIGRFLIFGRPLGDGELQGVMEGLMKAVKPVVPVRKILFLGNSITLHGPAPEIGWEANRGMAASSDEKDYVHLVTAGVEAASGRVPEVRVRNIADFERGYGMWDAAVVLREELAFGADTVVVAIGENAAPLDSEEKAAAFERACGGLLRVAGREGGARVVVRSCFWPDAAKDGAMRRAAEKAGAEFLDISALGKDPANAAGSEREIKHAGVAGHPGDRGMRAIAEAILGVLRGGKAR